MMTMMMKMEKMAKHKIMTIPKWRVMTFSWLLGETFLFEDGVLNIFVVLLDIDLRCK